MLSHQAPLTAPVQHAVTGNFLADCRTNDQFPLLGGLDLQGLPGVSRWHRVEIALIRDHTIPAGTPSRDEAGIIAQCSIPGLEAFQWQANKGDLIGCAMDATIGYSIEPLESLGIEIVQIGEMQSWPEVPPHILDAVFDFALRLRTTREASLAD